MKAIDGLELIRMIKYGEIEENTRIIVLEDNKEYDVYDVVAELTYKGGETLWGEGTFRLSMLYDKKHFFETIEEEKEIEKISDKTRYYFRTQNNGMTKTDREALDSMFEIIYKTIDEILDELIKIKKEGK